MPNAAAASPLNSLRYNLLTVFEIFLSLNISTLSSRFPLSISSGLGVALGTFVKEIKKD